METKNINNKNKVMLKKGKGKAAAKKVKKAAKKAGKAVAKGAKKAAKKAAKKSLVGVARKAVKKRKAAKAGKAAAKGAAKAAKAAAKGKGPAKYDRVVLGGNKGDKSKSHPGRKDYESTAMYDKGASMSDELKYRGMMDQFKDGESMGKATSMYDKPGMYQPRMGSQISKHMKSPGMHGYKMGTGGRKLK